jgi:acetyl esterase/lipase
VVRLAATAGLLFTLVGCSTVGVLNALSASDAVAVSHDIAYGPQPRQQLDVYAPKAPAAPRPVVVFFYGGGWDSGDKASYAWVGQALAAQGFVTIVADYRLYPEVRWPTFLQDCALATRWAKDHASTFNGDPGKLILMGHSAGAYNAIELALDKRWLGAVGLEPQRDLRGAIGLSGPYDFLPLHSEELKTIFGPAPARPDTQPINHVDGSGPALLLVTGDKDTTVQPGNSDRLAAKVRAAGEEVTVIHYPRLDHVRAVAALAPQLRWLAPIMRDVRNFVDSQTGARATPPA